MCFVFEHQQPFFAGTIIQFNIDFNAASVDFFTFVQVFKFACTFEIFGTNSCQVHQSKRSVFVWIQFFFDSQIFFVGSFYCFVFDSYFVKDCVECCMTAVVRPVCVNHTQFCKCRIAFFLVFEVILTESQVICVHSKTVLFDKIAKSCFIHIYKAFNNRCFFWQWVDCFQCFWFFKGSQTGFNRVDDMFLDFFQFFFCNVAIKFDNTGVFNSWSVAACYKLYTLLGRVCTLVKLTWQQFCCKCVVVNFDGVCNIVNLWFREDSLNSCFKCFFVYTFDVIAVVNFNFSQAFDAQGRFQVVEQ